MDGKPLTLARAWSVYDKLFSDTRVAFLPEPRIWSYPKMWADAFLIAMAIGHQAQIISLDQALKTRFADCLILE
jgi:hypothetical protein